MTRQRFAAIAAFVVCVILAIAVADAGALDDSSAYARQAVTELISAELVKPLKGQRVIIADLTAHDQADRQLASVAADYQSSLQTATINAGFFRVVERAQLERILKELQLQLTDLADPEQVQRVGKLVNADLLLLGDVTQTNGRVRVSLRLVQVHTAEAIRAVEQVLSEPFPATSVKPRQDEKAVPTVTPAPTGNLSPFRLHRTFQNVERVRSTAISPDGSFVATGADDGVRVWSLSDRDLRPVLKNSTVRNIYGLYWSPKGDILAAVTGGGELHQIDAKTGEGREKRDNVGNIAFSRNGELLAIGPPRLYILRCKVERRDTGKSIELAGSSTGTTLLFSPDSKTVVGWRSDGLRSWDASSGDLLWWTKDAPEPFWDLPGHISVSRDGKTVYTFTGASESGSGSVRSTLRMDQYDAATGQRLGESDTISLPGEKVLAGRLTPDGRMLVIASSKDSEAITVTRWDLSQRKVIDVITKRKARDCSLGLDAAGQVLTIAWDDGEFTVWNSG